MAYNPELDRLLDALLPELGDWYRADQRKRDTAEFYRALAEEAEK